MCGRQYVWLIAIGVEGVFDDVVTSDANGVNEELAGEGGQVEPRPNIGAVEYDGSFWSAAILAPRCEHAPVARKQPAPKTHRFCAVARPVVRGDKTRVVAVFVTEEHKIRGEVKRRKISRAIGLQLFGQFQPGEAEYLDVCGDDMADM